MLQPAVDGNAKSLEPGDSISDIDEFLAIISHELRIPMSAILGWAEVLDNKQIDQTCFAKAIEMIRHSALAQAQLIDELLDYSSVGANKFALRIRAVSLAPIVKAAVETLSPMACKKLLHVDVQLGSSEAEIDGDPMRLQQVFANLFSNAIKFTPCGGRVTVLLESGGDYHTVTLSDSGEGISAEFLPFVFDRYRQADRTASWRGGLGLGLTIAHHIVELHDGTIKAESGGKGQGAVFIVQLPCRSSHQRANSQLPVTI